VLVHSRSIEFGCERRLDSGLSNKSLVIARLVVPSGQVGCWLGKGEAIILEMRNEASIKIVGADQVPKCESDNDLSCTDVRRLFKCAGCLIQCNW